MSDNLLPKERQHRLEEVCYRKSVLYSSWDFYTCSTDMNIDDNSNVGCIIPLYRDWRTQWQGRTGEAINPMEFDWTVFDDREHLKWLETVIRELGVEKETWICYNIYDISTHYVCIRMDDFILSLKRFYNFVAAHPKTS